MKKSFLTLSILSVILVMLQACTFQPAEKESPFELFSKNSAILSMPGGSRISIDPKKVSNTGNHYYVPLYLKLTNHRTNCYDCDRDCGGGTKFIVGNHKLILNLLEQLEIKFNGTIDFWKFEGLTKYSVEGMWFDLKPNEVSMKTDTAVVKQNPALVKTGYHQYNRKEYMFFPAGGSLEETFGMSEEEALDYAMDHNLLFKYKDGKLHVTVREGQKFVKIWTPVN